MVGILGEHVAEKLAFGLVVGGLEAADQLVQGRQNLLGQLASRRRSGTCGCRRGSRAAAASRQAEEPLFAEQHVQGGEDRPAGDLGHLCDAERGVAARLAARGIDQADLCVVDQAGRSGLGSRAAAARTWRAGWPASGGHRSRRLCPARCRRGVRWISIIHGLAGSFGVNSRTTWVGRRVSWYSGSVTSIAAYCGSPGRTGSRSFPASQARSG